MLQVSPSFPSQDQLGVFVFIFYVLELKFTTNAIDLSVPSNAETSSIDIQIAVELRGCNEGEVLLESGK